MGSKTKARSVGKKNQKPDKLARKDGNGSVEGNGSAVVSASVTNGSVSIALAAMQSSKRFTNWKSFRRHLSTRKKPRPCLNDVFGDGKKYALSWAWPELPESAGAPCQRYRKSVGDIGKSLVGKRKIKRRDSAWLADFADGQKPESVDLEYARLAVALASIMPQLAEVAEEAAWWHALKNLIGLTDAAQPLDETEIVIRQLLTIELPLTLARQLPEIPACAVLAEPASEFLIVEQSEMLDTDGWPHARNVPQLPLLLATWTRCHYLLQDLKRPLDNSAQAIWEWFVRQSLRLLRGDGSWMFSRHAVKAHPELLSAAVSTSRDRTDHRIARNALPWMASGKKEELQVDKEECFSEWAGVGVLHSNWTPKSPKVGILADVDSIQLEVCRGNQLFRLDTPPRVSINGRLLGATTEWDVICDHVDDDVEHLELELELEDGIRLQRQICLSRGDQFLLLADVILTETEERVDYSQVLELGPGISTIEETETREIYLRDAKRIRSLVMPLGMPEWKSQRCDHELTCSPGQIQLSQSGLCQNLYAGLFVDLSPRRSKHPRTWRQLTVADSLQIVPQDVAVAFRVRVGPDQFVIYRSLDVAGNRTFLGQNHSCEFFLGRLEKDGLSTEIISVEP